MTVAATTATAVTAGGTICSAYRHNGPITLGATTYPANGQQDNAVLVHHSQTGNVLSVRMVVTNGTISDLETDAAGNLYAAGRFGTRIITGVRQDTAQETSDFFVAKWNAAGQLQWLSKAAASQSLPSATPVAVAIDSVGNVTLGADFTGTVTVGPRTLTSAAPQVRTLMLAQFSATGSFNWAFSSTNSGSNINFSGLAAAPDGTLHIVGTAPGSFNWRNFSVNSSGTKNGFWLKTNGTGTALAAVRYGNTGQGIATPRVGTDYMGMPYVAVNSFESTLNWGNSTFSMPTGDQNGFFVAGLNPNGVPRWMHTGSLPDSSFASVSSLKVVSDLNDGNNVTLYLGGNFLTASPTVALRYGSLSLNTPGRRRSYDGFVMALDGSTGSANWLIPAVESNGADYLDVLGANVGGQISVGGIFTGDTAHFDNIRIQNSANGAFSAFTAKRLLATNLAQGTAFTDINTNGTRDSGEPAREGVIVETQPGNLVFSTGSTGQYDAVLELGNYTFSVPNPPLYYNAVSTANTVVFNTYGNLSTGHDFALQAATTAQDLRISLTPVGRARPGFTLTYRVTYRNVGTIPVTGGTVQLDFAPILSFLNSSQTVTQTGSTLSWPYGALQPGEVRNVDLLFQIPTTAQPGSTLVSTARIDPLAGDLTPTDNSELNTLRVTASYDPNDISVNYELLTPQQVQRGDWLEYVVRFQNLGSDTAFYVLLHDSLPSQLLRLSTLQIIAASHNCMWGLKPNGLLSISFPKIKLPHRNANSIRSQGFVRFRVKPMGTLVVGDIIPNQANIFFDFNPPVNTNTATTEINQLTGQAGDAEGFSGSVWPNPASGILNVEAEVEGAVVLTLLDATGRVVLTHSANNNNHHLREQLDIQALPAGLYLLRAQAGGRAFTRRLVLH